MPTQPPGIQHMAVEIEDLTLPAKEGPERRVDTHNLVIYLSQLAQELRDLRAVFEAHAAAEAGIQEEVRDLVQVLKSFKVTLGFLKYVAGAGGAIAAIAHWWQPIIAWFSGGGK